MSAKAEPADLPVEPPFGVHRWLHPDAELIAARVFELMDEFDLKVEEPAGGGAETYEEMIEAWVAAHDVIGDVIARLNSSRGKLAELLEGFLSGSYHKLEDGRKVSTDRSVKTRYDNAMILSVFAARFADAVVDRETGEVPPIGVITEMTVKELAAFTGAGTPSYDGWRKGVAKRYNIDLTKYVTEKGEAGPVRTVVQ